MNTLKRALFKAKCKCIWLRWMNTLETLYAAYEFYLYLKEQGVVS